MKDLPLRPRSSTEIVDASFQIYQRNPVLFMVSAAVVYVPWLVIRLVFDLGVTEPVKNLGSMAVMALGWVLVYALVGGVSTVLASGSYLDESVDVPSAYRAIGARLIPLIVASVIRWVLVTVGLVLFLFPGLYAMGRFFAVTPAVVLERRGAINSLSRSGSLSIDLKRHIINTILLVGLIVIAVNVGLGLLIGMFKSPVLLNTTATLLSLVTAPFFGITETVLYYDARIRREGFDVEYLALGGDALPVAQSAGSQ